MSVAEPDGRPDEVRLRDRGPAVVPLDLPVVRAGAASATGGEGGTTREVTVPDDPRGNVALCRCGHSAIRPFCDGTHRSRQLGHDRLVEPPDAAAGPVPDDLGPSLVLQDDGPLRLCGGVSVRLPDGTVVAPADGTGLCRCGASTSRPWCDGSHSSCGFREHG
ncbi:CDGSH iron-sulfur domain-containing protein [Salsipaludibacter albus]|uniref:CDGSH iron-sulfur domain-containing protein n=1 Tax=Salsipaludibacter albus TaxID=2849650 RepID=UPI001EE42C2C|nr:CDGSH iron-sulfur domain-containing protein [Salsipaludibacter albus]MBY5162331.1 CDGSH iron-sulfur domain-containing protein [Salsipaludibacter albus]